ncbi:MAG: flippase-like domain-containing protein, partial [Thermoplasmatales archaeon]|nr:flippase-like domain-containing protein [Thermoplasmatales archaeon]
MKIPIILSIVLSISIIFLILIFTIDTTTFDYLSTASIRYEFFAAAVLLNILTWVLWGIRLKVLCNAIDKNVHIGLWKSTRIVIANLFLAGITPSMAGGEPVRIYLLNKNG